MCLAAMKGDNSGSPGGICDNQVDTNQDRHLEEEALADVDKRDCHAEGDELADMVPFHTEGGDCNSHQMGARVVDVDFCNTDHLGN